MRVNVKPNIKIDMPKKIKIFGIFFLTYRIFRRFSLQYLSTRYSIQAQTAILTLNDINLTPNILIFFGISIFILGFTFTLIALFYSREKGHKKQGILGILIYTFFYLL